MGLCQVIMKFLKIDQNPQNITDLQALSQEMLNGIHTFNFVNPNSDKKYYLETSY